MSAVANDMIQQLAVQQQTLSLWVVVVVVGLPSFALRKKSGLAKNKGAGIVWIPPLVKGVANKMA